MTTSTGRCPIVICDTHILKRLTWRFVEIP
jgi:hypothetical protein